jgi:hypothetical protein
MEYLKNTLHSGIKFSDNMFPVLQIYGVFYEQIFLSTHNPVCILQFVNGCLHFQLVLLIIHVNFKQDCIKLYV